MTDIFNNIATMFQNLGISMESPAMSAFIIGLFAGICVLWWTYMLMYLFLAGIKPGIWDSVICFLLGPFTGLLLISFINLHGFALLSIGTFCIGGLIGAGIASALLRRVEDRKSKHSEKHKLY